MSGGDLTVRIRGPRGVRPPRRARRPSSRSDSASSWTSTSSCATPLASRTDELIDTVDYASLADAVCALVSGPPVALLERLAGMIADLVLEDPRARAVTVTVRKPHVALPHPVRETAVTLRRAGGP